MSGHCNHKNDNNKGKSKSICNPAKSSTSNKHAADTNSNNSNNNTNPKRITITSTTNGANTDTRACAACKYHRRKCAQDCPLAPYFPPDNHKQFLNAHKLFGLRNMMKIYRGVEDPKKRDEAMKSMIIEASIRANDPVGGCHRVVQELNKQLQLCRAELDLVLTQLAHFHTLGSVAAGVEPPIPPDPGTSDPGTSYAQSMLNLNPEIFCGYPNLYDDSNLSTSYGDVSTPSLVPDRSEDGKGLVEGNGEDIKPDFIKSNTSEKDEQRYEGNIAKPPKQENVRDAT